MPCRQGQLQTDQRFSHKLRFAKLARWNAMELIKEEPEPANLELNGHAAIESKKPQKKVSCGFLPEFISVLFTAVRSEVVEAVLVQLRHSGTKQVLNYIAGFYAPVH